MHKIDYKNVINIKKNHFLFICKTCYKFITSYGLVIIITLYINFFGYHVICTKYPMTLLMTNLRRGNLIIDHL